MHPTPLAASVLILALLGGCAGTRQASVEPAPAVVETPAPVVADTSTNGIAVVEVVPAAAPTQVAAVPDPFQCMMAWARGAQDALMPWARSVQACEPYRRQP